MDDLPRLRALLGLPGAPLVDSNLLQTLLFFRTVLFVDPFEASGDGKPRWLGYLHGIDFHRPVTYRELPPETRMSRHSGDYLTVDKPFVYLTKPGTSPYSTGTSFPESVFELWKTTVITPALESYAAPMQYALRTPGGEIVQHRADASRMGGGLQYIISKRAFTSLRSVRSAM